MAATPLTRLDLAKFLPNQRAVKAFESLLETSGDAGIAIAKANAAQLTADNAQTSADAAQLTANAAQLTANAAQLTANAAQTSANLALSITDFLILAPAAL